MPSLCNRLSPEPSSGQAYPKGCLDFVLLLLSGGTGNRGHKPHAATAKHCQAFSTPFQKGVGAGLLAKATALVLLGTSCSADLHPKQRVHGTVSSCIAHQSICTGITNCSVRHLAHSRVFTSELSSGKVAFSGENPRGIFLCKPGCPRAWSCQAGMAGPAAV